MIKRKSLFLMLLLIGINIVNGCHYCHHTCLNVFTLQGMIYTFFFCTTVSGIAMAFASDLPAPDVG